MPNGNALRTDYIRDIGAQYQPRQAQINALRAQAMQQQIGQREQMFPFQIQQARMEIERSRFKSEQEAIDALWRFKDNVTYQNYPTFRQAMITRGLNPALLPESFASEAEFTNWKIGSERQLEAYRAQTARITAERGPAPKAMAEYIKIGVKPGEATADDIIHLPSDQPPPKGYRKSRVPPVRIDIGEEITRHAAKVKATAEVKKEIAMSAPQFRSNIIRDLKAMHGDDWQDKESFEKEGLIFQEMDSRIKTAYPNQNIQFGKKNAIEGWYDVDSGKLIRKYTGPEKIYERRDKLH